MWTCRFVLENTQQISYNLPLFHQDWHPFESCGQCKLGNLVRGFRMQQRWGLSTNEMKTWYFIGIKWSFCESVKPCEWVSLPSLGCITYIVYAYELTKMRSSYPSFIISFSLTVSVSVCSVSLRFIFIMFTIIYTVCDAHTLTHPHRNQTEHTYFYIILPFFMPPAPYFFGGKDTERKIISEIKETKKSVTQQNQYKFISSLSLCCMCVSVCVLCIRCMCSLPILPHWT